MEVIHSARLALRIDRDAARREVRALPDRWVRHFQTLHYEGDWSALALRSIGGDADNVVPFANGGDMSSVASYAPTPLLDLCPVIAAFLDTLRCPVFSARLLRLGAGAVIKPHRDVELAFEQGSARIHVPILTNDAVDFRVEGRRIEMDAGSCWYINANLHHEVANRGAEDRIHLVVDCAVDDWLRSLFDHGEVTVTTIRRDPDEAREIIRSLHLLGTPTALELIATIESELSDHP